MTKKPEKPPTLDEIISEMPMPKITKLGRKAIRKMQIGKKLEIPKDIGKSEYDYSIKKLEKLKKEISKPRRREKTRNLLEPSSKETLVSAIFILASSYTRTTGYNAKWVVDAVENNWKAGTAKIKHDYEKRIRCCSLIHFLVLKKLSVLQAIAITDQIYDFNKTDAKDVYYYFRRNPKKYYFPEVKNKKNIPIFIFLDIAKYGKISVLRGAYARDKAIDVFDKNMLGAVELLRNEMQFAKRKKLKSLGVEIYPVMEKFLENKYENMTDLIKAIPPEMSKDGYYLQGLIYAVNVFLNDLEFYRELEE